MRQQQNYFASPLVHQRPLKNLRWNSVLYRLSTNIKSTEEWSPQEAIKPTWIYQLHQESTVEMICVTNNVWTMSSWDYFKIDFALTAILTRRSATFLSGICNDFLFISAALTVLMLHLAVAGNNGLMIPSTVHPVRKSGSKEWMSLKKVLDQNILRECCVVARKQDRLTMNMFIRIKERD